MADIKESKGLNKFWTIWNIVEDVILLAAGVLAIVFGCLNGNDNVRNVINTIMTYAIASFIILDGLLRLIMTLLKVKSSGDESIMLVSGFEITLGIVMMIVLKEDLLVKAMVYFIAVGAIVIGAMFLAFSIVSLIRKSVEKYTMPILEIIFGGILIGVGLYIIILYNVSPEAKNRICLILTGSVLSIVAVALAIITLISCRKRKKKALVPVDSEKEKRSKKEKKEPKKEKEEVADVKEVEVKDKEEPKMIEADVKEIEHKPEDKDEEPKPEENK